MDQVEALRSGGGGFRGRSARRTAPAAGGGRAIHSEMSTSASSGSSTSSARPCMTSMMPPNPLSAAIWAAVAARPLASMAYTCPPGRRRRGYELGVVHMKLLIELCQ